jgi:IS30 family transposase
MANKLTDEKRDELFAAYQEKQSVSSVARKCRVSPTTVARYKIKDDWVARLARIVEKAQRKADDDAARRRARHIKLAQLLQVKGADYLAKKGCKSDAVAVGAVRDGVKMEREIVGEGGIADGDAVLVVKLVQSNG